MMINCKAELEVQLKEEAILNNRICESLSKIELVENG